MKIELSHAPGYQLTGDNVDLYVKAKHMSSTNQNSSIHWFSINAVLNRVNNNQLNNNKPIMFVLEMENSQFLPSAQDNVNILQDFIPLVSRVLVTMAARRILSIVGARFFNSEAMEASVMFITL